MNYCSRDRHSLFHSTAQCARRSVSAVEYLHRCQRSLRFCTRTSNSIQACSKLDVLARCKRVVEKTVMRNDSNPAPDFGTTRQLDTANACFPGGWFENSAEHSEESGFPGAIRSENREGIARRK